MLIPPVGLTRASFAPRRADKNLYRTLPTILCRGIGFKLYRPPFSRQDEAPMRTLVYKRTHSGDPDPKMGVFGNHDCMGEVRAWPFDAVIGIGGVGQQP